jgi:rRNA maturation RNase YbeY
MKKSKIRFRYSTPADTKIPQSKTFKKGLLLYAESQNLIIDLTYTFVSEEEIQEKNKFYLDHDYPTDILSFEAKTSKTTLEAHFYVCLEFTKNYAIAHNLDIETEFLRVLIHGLLHFLGYNDDTLENTTLMRKKEDEIITFVRNNMR